MKKWTAVLIAFGTTLALLRTGPAAAAETLVIIVNAANPITSIHARDLADYFLKVKREWPNGKTVRFIDRKSSPERRAFFEKVLSRSEDAIDRYWIGQKLETGLSAPVQAASDSMSIQFVAVFPGAIGYLPAGTEVKNKDVKTIKLDTD